MLSARNRELLGLGPAALLITGGFAAIFVQSQNSLSNVSLTYGLFFLALCVGAHVAVRIVIPQADPYLLPLAAALASFGLVMLYRINPTLAREQAQWFVLGLILFVGTIVVFRAGRYAVLERYRYTIALAGIVGLMLPRLPGIGAQENGAYLKIKLGPIAFQPSEFAKIAIVVFLASYLRDNRQVLVTGGQRVLGLTIPPMKQFGPLLVVWGAAMAMLLITRELGTSLMFFGVILALLYVATGRLSFPLAGLVLFALGAWFVATHVAHVHDRVLAWEHPFDKTLYAKSFGGSYQLAQGLFAQADGGLLGTGFDSVPADARPAGRRSCRSRRATSSTR